MPSFSIRPCCRVVSGGVKSINDYFGNEKMLEYCSAFNLEEPLLCFVVNKYVLCSEKVTIALGLKFAMSVHTSFRSVCKKSGLIMLVDSKVVAACVPGIGLQL